MRRGVLVALLCVAAGAAVAAGLDARGWTPGEPAANASRVLGPLADEPLEMALPKRFAKQLSGPTLLVYLSPTCPHCVRVAPELQALAGAVTGKATVIGIVPSYADPATIAGFVAEQGITFEMRHDADGTIGAAMGARGTPSAALVERKGKKVLVKDLWYPYAPGTEVLVRMRLAGDKPFDAFAPGAYQGNRACGACHTQELESWLVSHHSIAWRTLQRSGDHTDAACTDCHVTGAGQPGGWTPGDERLVDVGCESCHGPGGPHDGTATTPATTCDTCHDPKHSVGFRYDRALPLIDHYKASAMTDAEWRAARGAFLDGEVEQRLFAFDEGRYVGAAACASCHEGAQAKWSESRHGKAMGTLRDGNTDGDARCVSCHATPLQTGPRPQDVAGYRTSEGVGCESCHGPGGVHVDAGGGTDNIIGLGESCPVCVIEAVCTSCHTPVWDPSWDLETDLKAVGHGGSAAGTEGEAAQP